jgi:hypothetical protein
MNMFIACTSQNVHTNFKSLLFCYCMSFCNPSFTFRFLLQRSWVKILWQTLLLILSSCPNIWTTVWWFYCKVDRPGQCLLDSWRWKASLMWHHSQMSLFLHRTGYNTETRDCERATSLYAWHNDLTELLFSLRWNSLTLHPFILMNQLMWQSDTQAHAHQDLSKLAWK